MAGFTMVPNDVLRGKVRRADGTPLSLTERVLYGIILDYSNAGTRPCTASQETLARDLGRSTRTVHTAQQELAGAGVIRVQREGKGLTNTIWPLLLPDRKPASGHPQKLASDKQDLSESKNEGSSKEEASGRDNRDGARA